MHPIVKKKNEHMFKIKQPLAGVEVVSAILPVRFESEGKVEEKRGDTPREGEAKTPPAGSGGRRSDDLVGAGIEPAQSEDYEILSRISVC